MGYIQVHFKLLVLKAKYKVYLRIQHFPCSMDKNVILRNLVSSWQANPVSPLNIYTSLVGLLNLQTSHKISWIKGGTAGCGPPNKKVPQTQRLFILAPLDFCSPLWAVHAATHPLVIQFLLFHI